MTAMFEICGMFTNEPVRIAHERRLRKALVCFTRETEQGNPYVVPGFWIDSVSRCRCHRNEPHYLVKSDGREFRVGPSGSPFNAPCE